jgi:hypothetical protein
VQVLPARAAILIGQRDAGMHLRLVGFGMKVVGIGKRQPVSAASSLPIVVLPDPVTPMSTRIIASFYTSGGATACLLGNGLLDVVNHGGGAQSLLGYQRKILPSGRDDGGGKRVGECIVAAGAHADVKELVHRIQFRSRRSGKIPVRKSLAAGSTV